MGELHPSGVPSRHRPSRRARSAAAGLALVAGAAVVATAPAQAASSAPAAKAVCKPTTPTATVKLAKKTAPMGGTIKVTGTGWCHPTNGGSTVAIKIDEGAYSRLDSSVNPNRTVWAIIQANPKNGKLNAVIKLPSGKTSGANGSTPAFPAGKHTFRLLSGSLKAGDTIRTVQSPVFTVKPAK
ncbi:exported hypothetical protein [Nostocoides japonicum T1-X7]|uniref:Secreted protein n=1 Tax=Nostocoides japonicum T1-X7 TaxID=1194083 RepID=A0A077LVP7_9MICO|nr:hypothetical protein [Tetrasphaera japonica]CCH76892.1 exported hypothetical protein [Tetrasphaera japonica T1-X7]